MSPAPDQSRPLQDRHLAHAQTVVEQETEQQTIAAALGVAGCALSVCAWA